MGLVRLIFFFVLVYYGVRLMRVWLANVGQRAPRPQPGDPQAARPPPSPGKNPYDVLEVSASASQAEIRAAYQRLVRQYHPDRIADMGPELRALAEEKTKEINAAYTRLRER